MAKNPPPGPGRVGAVKGRTQTLNTRNDKWTKRDRDTGKFMDVKSDGKPFKGVTKEVKIKQAQPSAKPHPPKKGK